MLSLDTEIDKVVHLKDEDEKSFTQIGKELGFSRQTAKRRYETGLLRRALFSVAEEDVSGELPETDNFTVDLKSHLLEPDDKSFIERFQPITRTGDCIVVADLHIPLHDVEFLNVLINFARKKEQNKLIIAGDYFHMEAFSSFLPHQPEASWPTERYQGNLVMRTLLQTFDEIDMIWGNHDFRLTKAVGFKHSFEECMRFALAGLADDEQKRVRISDLDHMLYMPGSGRTFRVCHPRDFSSVPLTVPRKLAIKYNQSVITGHSHHCAIGAAPNGFDLVIEAGGFFDKDKTEYIQKTSAHHEWTQGFVSFEHGIPTLISPTIGNDTDYR